MKREKITPKDKADWLQMRAKDITSTEVSALFDYNPYMTKFELWQNKRCGVIPDFHENERMKWGSRLETAIAAGIAEDNQWAVSPLKDYIRLPELNMGSSFDFMITDKPALLEIKNVDGIQFAQKWEDHGDNIEAPPHIELQVQYQMLVAGVAEAYIGALIGGNQVRLIKREIDDDIAGAIKERVFEFWESVRKGQSPDPDFKRDAGFITKLYSQAREGTVLEVKDDQLFSKLTQQYKFYGEQKSEAETNQKAVKAELLTLIGDAAKVTGDGFSITAGVTEATRIEAYDRAAFRNFRINFKKEKK